MTKDQEVSVLRMNRYYKVLLHKAVSNQIAVPAFNMPTLDFVAIAAESAFEARAPLIIQTSEKIADFYGPRKIVKFIDSMQKEMDCPLFIHLDHCQNYGLIRDCIES